MFYSKLLFQSKSASVVDQVERFWIGTIRPSIGPLKRTSGYQAILQTETCSLQELRDKFQLGLAKCQKAKRRAIENGTRNKN